MFSALFAFPLIIFLVVGGDAKAYRFDYRYSQNAAGWLKFHEMPTTWDEARVICHAEGAVLISPLNENIKLEMMTVMAHHNSSCGVFAGIHATFAKGVFTSVEGIPLSKIPIDWARDEPDNFENNEDCLMMLPNGTTADVKCGDVFPFICYREKSKKNVLTGCGTVDNLYTLDTRTGSCYKFHVLGQTWANAFMTCASEGAHLAIINSDVEAQALRELFAKYPDNKLFAHYKGSALLGFREWNDNGDWFTIHGDTLQEAGYSTWAGGQPDTAKSNGIGQHCGSMFRDAKLDDIWCNEFVSFICEKNPDSLYEEENESQ